MIIHDLYLEGTAALPAKDKAPWIVDSNRVHSRLSTVETLQAVAGWYTQVLQLSRLVQIEQFAPGCPAKAGGKCPGDLRATIIEKVFRKSVSKGHDDVSKLSELDKIGCKKYRIDGVPVRPSWG